MLLALDVGNTNIVLGIYKGQELKLHFRVSTDRNKTSDEYGHMMKGLLESEGVRRRDISAVIISTVVPPITDELRRMCQNYFATEPLFVEVGVKTGLNIKYENPREVGADRIVNAVAAYYLYGGPAIVVDFGTATTFCAISANGEYLGGAIAPGVGISTEALFDRAAKLPRVELKKPERVIGKNTVESMQSGIYFGYVGLVDEMIGRIKAEMKVDKVKVVATGGLAPLIAGESKYISEVSDLLTLEGLRMIYERNAVRADATAGA